MSNEIKISVRNLVEFILRHGSIDNRVMGSSRALEGTKAHQKLQKSYGEEYSPEVSLKHKFNYKDLCLVLEGRADGILKEKEKVFIDEIKTTRKNFLLIEKDYNPMHWAQAKFYAYIYALQNSLNSIGVQLTYYNLDSNEIKTFREIFTFEDLEKFVYDIIQKYYEWASFASSWAGLRNDSIKSLSFPYPAYRKGQRDFAVRVYKTIKEKKKCFAQAPTGIGKTISTLFPTIKAMGENLTSKIFYLTAKTITRTVAEQSLGIMKAEGLKLKWITLTAKDKICFKEKSECNPEYCEFANGHYDRVNSALMDMLKNEDDFTRDKIEHYCRKYKICPFETALDLALWTDCIICDYNYVFDPIVCLKSLLDNKKENFTFLIDEAHNLTDRAREMYSAEIYKKNILNVKKKVKELSPSISKVLNKINSILINIKKECEDTNYITYKESPKELVGLLWQFTEETEKFLLSNSKIEDEDFLQLYFDALKFIKIYDLYDDKFMTYAEKSSEDLKLKLYCIDPSKLIKQGCDNASSVIFFSATLLPISYFHYLLNKSEKDYTLSLPSPFSTDNRCLMVGHNISTKYNQRQFSYSSIAEYINEIMLCKPGNYMVFFPSYKYMLDTYEVVKNNYPSLDIEIQKMDMSEEDKEDFLLKFKPNSSENHLAFCVLGGIFSEGIDLAEDRLIGVIIVGVGLPQICLERDLIKNYYNKKNSFGFEYAYTYPGMIKVLQAAGRCIRSENDKGTILLLDQRFLSPNYQNLFPREWFPYIKVRNFKEAGKYVKDFWSKLPPT